VTVTRTDENVTRILDTVNCALERLGEVDLRVAAEDIIDITAEWTGVRKDRPEADISELSELKKYEKLSEDAENDTVILHCHGGGYLCVLSRREF
jgi:hypothetical protein